LNEDIYETGIPGDYAFLGSQREWRFNKGVFRKSKSTINLNKSPLSGPISYYRHCAPRT
jgi:hypothetical protein